MNEVIDIDGRLSNSTKLNCIYCKSYVFIYKNYGIDDYTGDFPQLSSVFKELTGFEIELLGVEVDEEGYCMTIDLDKVYNLYKSKGLVLLEEYGDP